MPLISIFDRKWRGGIALGETDRAMPTLCHDRGVDQRSCPGGGLGSLPIRRRKNLQRYVDSNQARWNGKRQMEKA
jgi:hypothetical protein